MATYHNEDLIELLPETMEAVARQLEADAARWGDTWKQRSIGDQDQRIAGELQNYIDQLRNADQPLPYAKIIGLAHIALTRLNHPELLK